METKLKVLVAEDGKNEKARLNMQMVGVRNQHLRLGFQNVVAPHPLDRRARRDRHQGWRLHLAMGRFQDPEARAGAARFF